MNNATYPHTMAFFISDKNADNRAKGANGQKRHHNNIFHIDNYHDKCEIIISF